jgi:hypothetical protein
MRPLSVRMFFLLLLLYNSERNYTTMEMGVLDGLFYPSRAGQKGYFEKSGQGRLHESYLPIWSGPSGPADRRRVI